MLIFLGKHYHLSPGVYTHDSYYHKFRFTPFSISDSIWLSHGCFLVGSGNQMTMYGEPKILNRKRTQWDKERDQENESLFEYVARQNGPLEDYNPQMVLQCLLWGTFTPCMV